MLDYFEKIKKSSAHGRLLMLLELQMVSLLLVTNPVSLLDVYQTKVEKKLTQDIRTLQS
jgi:hypothetical protein